MTGRDEKPDDRVPPLVRKLVPGAIITLFFVVVGVLNAIGNVQTLVDIVSRWSDWADYSARFAVSVWGMVIMALAAVVSIVAALTSRPALSRGGRLKDKQPWRAANPAKFSALCGALVIAAGWILFFFSTPRPPIRLNVIPRVEATVPYFPISFEVRNDASQILHNAVFECTVNEADLGRGSKIENLWIGASVSTDGKNWSQSPVHLTPDNRVVYVSCDDAAFGGSKLFSLLMTIEITLSIPDEPRRRHLTKTFELRDGIWRYLKSTDKWVDSKGRLFP